MAREDTGVLYPRGSADGTGVLGFERRLTGRLLRLAGGPPVGVVLWNGEEVRPPRERPVARLLLRDRWALYRLLADPDFQFGELYRDGRVDVEGDLVAFLEAVYRAPAIPNGVADRPLPRPRLNTLGRARANIHHHYDIGNEFYRLWLDERMVYTCAYFARPDATLEEAQAAKMEHVCRKLRLRRGETVYEAGCGWGALALHMAANHGVRVRAFNISREQVSFARERARAEGLEGQVEFVEDDYRNITGSCDAFVSVGMLEHVGPRNFRDLGAIIDRCLSAAGRGLIHSIGRNRPVSPDRWIATRIFPGGHPPSLAEMTEVFEPFSFSVLDVENLRLHYAKTLGHWLTRFDARQDRVRRMFDDRFVRMWRLYLAGSLAAFTTGRMQLFQVAFARETNNDIPLTREWLYRDGL